MAGLQATLGLDASPFQRGLQMARGAMASFAGNVGAMAAKFATMQLVRAPQFLDDTVKYAAMMTNLSFRTGAAVDQLVQLSQAFSLIGKGDQDVSQTISAVQRSLLLASQGSVQLSKAFAMIGVDAKDMLARPVVESIDIILGNIKKLPETMRAATTQQLFGVFGEAGSAILSLTPEAIATAKEQSANLAKYIRENQNFFLQIFRWRQGFLPKFREGFAGFAVAVSTLIPSMDEFNNKDFTKMGEDFGLEVATWFETVADSFAGTIAYAVFGSLTNLVRTATKALVAGLSGLVALPLAVLGEMAEDLGPTFAKVLEKFLVGFRKVLNVWISAINHLPGVNVPLMEAGWEKEFAGGLYGFFAKFSTEMARVAIDAGKRINKGVDFLADGLLDALIGATGIGEAYEAAKARIEAARARGPAAEEPDKPPPIPTPTPTMDDGPAATAATARLVGDMLQRVGGFAAGPAWLSRRSDAKVDRQIALAQEMVHKLGAIESALRMAGRTGLGAFNQMPYSPLYQ